MSLIIAGLKHPTDRTGDGIGYDRGYLRITIPQRFRGLF